MTVISPCISTGIFLNTIKKTFPELEKTVLLIHIFLTSLLGSIIFLSMTSILGK